MFPFLTALLPILSSLIGRVIPDAGQAATANTELAKALLEHQGELDRAVAEAAKAQNEVNLAEAQSGSLFVSGWRPFVGWTCGAGCAYGFILQPFLAWLTGLVSAFVGAAIPAPPVLDMATLMGLLGGLLGLGTLRTVEKTASVDRKSIVKK